MPLTGLPYQSSHLSAVFRRCKVGGSKALLVLCNQFGKLLMQEAEVSWS